MSNHKVKDCYDEIYLAVKEGQLSSEDLEILRYQIDKCLSVRNKT